MTHPSASPIQSSLTGSGQQQPMPTLATAGAANSHGSVAGVAVVGGGPPVREQFAADELSIVLSHYDLGVIESIAEFPRGSRKAPKLIVATERGKFLLKRRARGRDEPQKVAFTHALQLYLASKSFPLPHLIGTRRHNNSMLQVHGGVYELFEFVAGQAYPQTLESTHEAGRVLATYHKLLTDFRTEWKPGAGSYHVASGVQRGFDTLLGKATATEERELLGSLVEAYRLAGETAEQVGLSSWPKQIVHADWHPGNMLFQGDRIISVIDYDSARFLPRVVDVANGALQFSILGGDDELKKWPSDLDESRFRRFLRGYDDVALLTEAEVRTVPWLMIEALIAEAVFPIAMTGHFGRMEGGPFLQMVRRKVSWMQQSADRLVEMAAG